MDDAARPARITRMRWRLRGATTWPAFAVLTVAVGLFVHWRPIAGTATGVVGGVLLAGFVNLALVAVGGPLGGRLARRRVRHVPLEILVDRAATSLLAAAAGVVLVVGLAHHSTVVATQGEERAMRAAVHGYVESSAPAYRAGLQRVSVWKQADHMYRACVPGRDPRRALCLYVQTDQSPPGVILDPDRTPNELLAGP